jgi:hypothetical protein
MAGGARPLLKLGAKIEAQPVPKDVPVFEPDRLSAQVGTDGGAYFVQGKNLFSLKGVFVKEAPENLWYVTTPEQEANNRKAKSRARAAVVNLPSSREPQLPDRVVEAARENARAYAAEALAE